jgi:hypothetical protein
MKYLHLSNKTTANKSIGKSRADGRSIGDFFIAQLQFGQEKQRSALVLNFNKIFSISSGWGRTEVYFPVFANA